MAFARIRAQGANTGDVLALFAFLGLVAPEGAERSVWGLSGALCRFRYKT